MAEENKSTTPPAQPAAEDTSKKRIKDLEADNLALKQRLEAAEKDVSFQANKIADLEKKLKSSKAAPTGNVVFLDGKTWPIKGTVKAKFALDEVKKGHVPDDVTLVVIDRIE